MIHAPRGEARHCWIWLAPTGEKLATAHTICQREVRLGHVPPGAYQVCQKNGIQTFCMTITIAAAPDPQTIDLP